VARQRTPIGAHGAITTRLVRPGLHKARTRVRDADGVLREVSRTGASKAAAVNNLRAALAERDHAGAARDLTGSTPVAEVAALWLEHVGELVDAGDRSPRTLATYEAAWRLHVAPALGELHLREATTARCEAWLRALRKRVGSSMCGTARAVLSGVLGYAARMDAIPANPVRDLSPIAGAGSRVRKPRSMTADERERWLTWLDSNVAHDPSKPRRPELHHPDDEVIASRALGDVTRFMLGTGCRIGEAMAVSWDEVDLEAGTVAIRWHIIRVRGRGLVRLEGAKSDAGERVLRLPPKCLGMLMGRRADPRSSYPVFPDAFGGWRDPNLVARWIRWSREEAGFEWLTSHVWRQTVITALDEAGLSTREVANQAGHAQITQTQDYMSRRVASDRAAQVLDGLL
jgi:integrase